MSGRGGAPGFKTTEVDRERGYGGGGWSGHGEYMQHKTAGLAEQYAARVQVQSQALRGVVLHVDGHTGTRQLELADLVSAHGGTYQQYLTSTVTHFLANTLPLGKLNHMKTRLAEAKRRGGQAFYLCHIAVHVHSESRRGLGRGLG